MTGKKPTRNSFALVMVEGEKTWRFKVAWSNVMMTNHPIEKIETLLPKLIGDELRESADLSRHRLIRGKMT